MAIYYVFLVLLAVNVSEQNTRITILYEALCPDSAKTISKLHSSFKNNNQNVQLEFVPYGKANHTFINGTWEFECQHFKDECELNKYHACGLKRIDSQSSQLDFVDCMMRNVLDIVISERVKKCSHDVGISLNEIERCHDSDEGNKLMVLNGDRTNPYKPLDTVPTILYNNTFNEALQEGAQDDPIGTIANIRQI